MLNKHYGAYLSEISMGVVSAHAHTIVITHVLWLFQGACIDLGRLG